MLTWAAGRVRRWTYRLSTKPPWRLRAAETYAVAFQVNPYGVEALSVAALSELKALVHLLPQADEIRKHRIGLATLETSGQRFESVEEGLVRREALTTLQAPFAPKHLARLEEDGGHELAIVSHEINDDFAGVHRVKLSSCDASSRQQRRAGARRRPASSRSV